MNVKFIYTTFVILYIGLITTWSFSFPISYKIVGTSPDIVETRSLTMKERDNLDKAYSIRRLISSVFLYSSILIAGTSFYLLKKRLFKPIAILKIVIVVSGLFAAIIILANGIGFIPEAPMI